MRGKVLFPNIPGHYESGRFRISLGRAQGREQLNLVYENECIASFYPGELADLQQILHKMELYLTGESVASYPPDDDQSIISR